MRRHKIATKTFQRNLETLLNTIGTNLHALRTNRNESLRTVAKTVKMSPSRLSKIEKGLCPHCRILSLLSLTKYYKVKMGDIVKKSILPYPCHRIALS